MTEYTILAIDDDAPARILYEIMLKRLGFAVVLTPDADEALEKLDNLTPDLIMSDIQLPGMNGIELVEILRQRDNLDKTAIVVLSAFQSDEKINEAMQAGADEFIKKPLKMDGLGERLISIIKTRRGE